MIRLGVRAWLTTCYGLMLTVMLVAFSVTVYLLVRHNLFSRLEFELDEELAELQQEVELAADRPDLNRQLTLRFGRHFSYEYEVSDGAGTSLFLSDRLQQTSLRTGVFAVLPTARNSEQQHLSGLGEYLVAGQVVNSHHGPLLIQVATPLAESHADLRELLVVFLTVGPLVLIVALLGGYALARTALAPVARIAATADDITVQRLDQRLDVSPVNDELSHLARTLNRMMDRLQQSFDEMQRFAADAAHELRTPLTVIRNEAEVTLRSPRSVEEYENTLNSIVEETIQLSQLTDRLLLLCHADSELGSHGRVPVLLEGSLAEAVEGLSSIARRKQIELDLELDDTLVVHGDPIQLRQLWINLIDNALKYTPEQGRVRISATLHERQAIVEVSDTGIGIPPEHLAHVFERFYRVDPSRHRDSGGAGLGLAICQTIVHTHGGDINLKSSIGEGTSVLVHLPCAGAG